MAIVPEGIVDLDAPFVERFAWPFPLRTRARKRPVCGVLIAGDLFGRAGGDDFAALVAAFGAHIDQPVGGLDDVEIVLDDEKRGAGFEEFAKGGEQFCDVVEMEAGGGLVENIEDALIFGAREMRGEFQPLGFAAGKRGGGLAEAEIAEADFVQDAQLGDDFGNAGEKGESFARGELQELRGHFCRDSARRGRWF